MVDHLIDGHWVDGEGDAFESFDPATGQCVWTGRSATGAQVGQAVRDAARAFDAAITEANNTSFGLVAALLNDRRELFGRFHRKVRCGPINWNRPATGASSYLPFGGVGRSGNHRTTGYFTAAYGSYPVASIECDRPALPEKRVPGLGG